MPSTELKLGIKPSDTSRQPAITCAMLRAVNIAKANPFRVVWVQHQILEELSVEKQSVRLTRPDTIARVICIAGDGQLIPHLEAHVKIFGHLVQIAPKMIGGGRTAEP
ncbi:MAG: hypothetical protein ACREJN_07420 [Nitrospiraceae bacterium]